MNLSKFQTAPDILPVESIFVPDIGHWFTPKGIPVYEVIKPGSNIVRLQLVFLAGRPYEEKKMVSLCCAHLLQEGAGKLNANQISEKVDYYGASLNTYATLDTINIDLVCLRKHFSKLVKTLVSILTLPHFDSNELSSFISRKIQKLQNDLSKNDVLAYRHLTEAIYGKEHPYGYNSSASHYQKVTPDDLRTHYSNFLQSSNCYIFLAGTPI